MRQARPASESFAHEAAKSRRKTGLMGTELTAGCYAGFLLRVFVSLCEQRFSKRALDIVIQRELPRVRAQVQGQDLVLQLVINPGFDDVLGKDIVFQQDGVIFFQGPKAYVDFALVPRGHFVVLGLDGNDRMSKRWLSFPT